MGNSCQKSFDEVNILVFSFSSYCFFQETRHWCNFWLNWNFSDMKRSVFKAILRGDPGLPDVLDDPLHAVPDPLPAGGRTRLDLPNPILEKRCCYITVDSAMAASQNGFCSYKLSIHKKTKIMQIMTKNITFFINSIFYHREIVRLDHIYHTLLEFCSTEETEHVNGTYSCAICWKIIILLTNYRKEGHL
jgi:hypothetical protein